MTRGASDRPYSSCGRTTYRFLGVLVLTEQLTDLEQQCVTKFKLPVKVVIAISAFVAGSKTPTIDMVKCCAFESRKVHGS